MSASPLRIGFIGLSSVSGGWAKSSHWPILKASSSLKLVAIQTSRPETAKASAEAFGLPTEKGYSSAEEIAKDPEVDLIAISVKTPLHKELAWPAISHGKSVFVEWPLARNLPEAEELVAHANKHGVNTFVGLQGRQGKAAQVVKELIDSGKLGKILHTSVSAYGLFGSGTTDKNGIYTVDVNNGANLITISFGHFLDLFAHLLGEFKTLSADLAIMRNPVVVSDSSDGETVNSTSPDWLSISGELESGARAAVVWKGGKNPNAPLSLDWHIVGTNGTLILSSASPFGPFVALNDPDVYLNGEKVDTGDDKEGGGKLARAWEKIAKGEAVPSLQDGLNNHKRIDAIFRSAETGQRVSYKL